MDISTIMAYEAGELDFPEVVELFQYLLDSGVVWHLQGSYGRTAIDLISQGLITNSPNHSARKRAKKRGAKTKATHTTEAPEWYSLGTGSV